MKLNLQQKKYATEDNFRKIISIITGMMSSVDNVASQCLKDYNPDEIYTSGQICLYNNYLWLCKTVTTGAFEETKWEKQTDNITELDLDTIKTFLGLTPEQLETMADIISSEIRTDKVFSSSETYTRIDNALKEAKQYCVSQLAQKSTGSFKIATSVAEVTDGNYLYLIVNDDTSKYDIYALVDGNIEKLTTVEVNLDNYFTKSEIEADFLKKEDADGKYATFTNVDDKIDKDKIITVLWDTSTDEQVPSALLTKTEFDKINESISTVNANLGELCNKKIYCGEATGTIVNGVLSVRNPIGKAGNAIVTMKYLSRNHPIGCSITAQVTLSSLNFYFRWHRESDGKEAYPPDGTEIVISYMIFY